MVDEEISVFYIQKTSVSIKYIDTLKNAKHSLRVLFYHYYYFFLTKGISVIRSLAQP